MPKSQVGALCASSAAFILSFIAWEAGLIALPMVIICAIVLTFVFIA